MSLQDLTIGVPKEIMPGEQRVAATPATAKKMHDGGARVLVESGAGAGSHFPDEEYKAAGAELLDNVEDLFATADLILKVKEPQFRAARGRHEIDMMKPGQVLVTFLHPANPDNHDMIRKLAARVGTLEPARVLILGAGVCGLQALATAKRLGAVLYAADVREEACQHAKSLGARLVDLHVPQDLAVGPGGYANTLPDEWLMREREILAAAVPQMDSVISSALVPGRGAPILLTEAMVKSMRSGSAIVDIAVDQGGNCEITEHGQVCEKHGVSIDGTKNIPGMVPTASTWMFANNVFNYVVHLVKQGRVILDMDDDIIASSLVTRDGAIVHAGALEAMAGGRHP